MRTNGRPAKGAPRPAAWFQVPEAIIREHARDIGPIGIAVYCAIKMHANKEWRCWPRVTTLAALLGVCKRTVQRTIQTLESVGLLTVERRQGAKSVYVLSQTGDTHVTGDKPAKASDTHVTTTRDTGVTTTGDTHVAAHDEPDPVEPDPINHTHTTRAAGVRENGFLTHQTLDPDDGWEKFRAAYPKVNNPVRARREWARLAPSVELQAIILTDINRRKESGKFRRGYGEEAHSYLADRLWETAIPAERNSRSCGYKPGMEGNRYERKSERCVEPGANSDDAAKDYGSAPTYGELRRAGRL